MPRVEAELNSAGTCSCGLPQFLVHAIRDVVAEADYAENLPLVALRAVHIPNVTKPHECPAISVDHRAEAATLHLYFENVHTAGDRGVVRKPGKFRSACGSEAIARLEPIVGDEM